jgi:hypothetical protein
MPNSTDSAHIGIPVGPLAALYGCTNWRIAPQNCLPRLIETSPFGRGHFGRATIHRKSKRLAGQADP